MGSKTLIYYSTTCHCDTTFLASVCFHLIHLYSVKDLYWLKTVLEEYLCSTRCCLALQRCSANNLLFPLLVSEMFREAWDNYGLCAQSVVSYSFPCENILPPFSLPNGVDMLFSILRFITQLHSAWRFHYLTLISHISICVTKNVRRIPMVHACCSTSSAFRTADTTKSKKRVELSP
jgi:hypothetical protein